MVSYYPLLSLSVLTLFLIELRIRGWLDGLRLENQRNRIERRGIIPAYSFPDILLRELEF